MLECWNIALFGGDMIPLFQFSIIPASIQPVRDFGSSWLDMPSVSWIPITKLEVKKYPNQKSESTIVQH
jgi:hypothetical protein